MYTYSNRALFILGGVGGTIVIYNVGDGKESLSRSLSMSSIVHVDGMFCLGRQGGEIGDGGSDLGIFLTCRGLECVGG
jgi:hypothetical protein